MKKFSICILVLIAIGGIFALSKNNFFQNLPQTKHISFSNIKNGIYTIENEPVALINGKSESEIAPGSASKLVTEYFGNEAVGDVNGDGISDTALLLAQSGGGTGVFYYVVVALGGKNGYTSTNTVFLGDRIAPQATEIDKGKIIVNYAERLPSEPFSAEPSVGVSKYFAVSGMELKKIKNPNSD